VVKRAGIVAAVVAIGVGVLAGPAVATVRIRHIDTSRFPTVGVLVSTDDGLRLRASNVRATENGLDVQVTSVRSLGSASGPVDAVLAIDTSNSMRGSKLETALSAAQVFLEQVPDWVHVGVLSFADVTTVVSPITSDRATVSAKVARMSGETNSGTALFDAVVAAGRMFGPTGQHNLILVTDGRNTTGQLDLEGAIAAARQSSMTVYTIGIGGASADVATLNSLATRTRGTYQAISPGALDAVYASLANQLGGQYVVKYVSRAPRGVPAQMTIITPDGDSTARFVTPALVVARPADDGLLAWFYTSNVGLLLAVLLSFIAAAAFMDLVTRVRSEAQREHVLRQRVAASSVPSRPDVAGAATVIPQPIADAFERSARATGIAAPVARMLERAAWRLTVGEFVTAWFGAAFVSMLVVGFLTRNPLLAIFSAVVFGTVPYVALSRAARKRAHAIQAQLADVMMVLASALRAGHSFLQALDTVSKEVGDPAATEFARALAEVRLGRSVDAALDALVKRIGSQDLGWAVTAISIQRRVGGNLAEILETLAGTIRERETLRRQMRVLSSEGRLSVAILMVMPFLIGLYIFFVNRTYMNALIGGGLGRMLLGGGLLLMIVGYVWMRRVVRLDV
jgi:tight adherence protein B